MRQNNVPIKRIAKDLQIGVGTVYRTIYLNLFFSQMNKLPDIISNINIITIETMGKYFFIAQSIDQIERLMSYGDTQNLMEDDDFDISLRKQSVTVEQTQTVN